LDRQLAGEPIETTLNEYGGLFESLHDELADRLDEARNRSKLD
jgi:hypothetical protein